MPVADSRKRANQKWDADHIKRFTVAMRSESYDIAKAIAEKQGKNFNRFICELVDAEIDRHISQ